MKRKGFTLIELLAVIVILAVIALIATPMILGVIETARKGSAESSALGYLDAVEKQIMMNQLDSSAIQITDGVYNLPMNGISIKGEQPSEGWIVIKNSKIEDYSMKIMDYIATKGNEVTKEGTVASKPEDENKPEASYICKRATVLHTEVCQGGQSCSSIYAADETITYGNEEVTTGQLKSGDALDCDVDGTGYNHRFYYVTDLESNPEYAVLLYYNNTTAGEADVTASSLIAYDSSNKNYQGPVTAIANLPTTEQWNKVQLYKENRAILTETGSSKTNGGPLPTAFSYSGYAARLLTYQEVAKACDGDGEPTTAGELEECNYLMENTKYSNSSLGTSGYWLETPRASSSQNVWLVHGNHLVNGGIDYYTSYSGVRPAIEILKSKISY